MLASGVSCHSDTDFNKTHVYQTGDSEGRCTSLSGDLVSDTLNMHFTDVYGHSLYCAESGVSVYCIFSTFRYLAYLTKNFTGSFG